MTFRKVFIDLLRSAYSNARHGIRTRTTRPLTSRRLSSLAARTTTRNPLIGCQSTFIRTEKLPRTQAKTFATTGAKNGQREIAVLGGGITGLTAAHYLARNAKNAHITLYEGSSRLGGWIHGEILHVGSGKNDKVLFQRGPRMLRPYSNSVKYDDIIFYDVVRIYYDSWPCLLHDVNRLLITILSAIGRQPGFAKLSSPHQRYRPESSLHILPRPLG